MTRETKLGRADDRCPVTRCLRERFHVGPCKKARRYDGPAPWASPPSEPLSPLEWQWHPVRGLEQVPRGEKVRP